MGKQGPEAESRSLVGDEGTVRGVADRRALAWQWGQGSVLPVSPVDIGPALHQPPQILAEQIYQWIPHLHYGI